MRIKNFLSTALLIAMTTLSMTAQPKGGNPGGKKGGMPVDTWEVNVKQMPMEVRANITETMANLKGTEEDRGIIADIGSAVGMGLVSGLVDAVVTETFNLAQYRKKQKQEWMRMIQNENNYTDSITSIKGLKDFYTSNSHMGALDPSNINFDGIEIRGIRNGQEVIYMSCSIDRNNLEHMFRHSKFNLVLDSLSFNPYVCHLPNVTANGIRTMKDIKKGKAEMRGDTIIRPGKGGNGFSFDERNNLRVAIDFSLYSSWINQAVQVHKNVELGQFNMVVNIPNNILGTYTYSRSKILEEAKKEPKDKQQEFLAENLIDIEGDCFVVPRSFMPLDNGKPMWGTGEYNIKVKIRESCQFADNSEKAKHWREDYKRLRQMQNRSSEVQEYLQTLWNQYGNTMVKSSYKTALTTGVNDLIPIKTTGTRASSMGSGAMGGGAQSKQGGAPAGGQTPHANQP
ncbi:MAG: hypothetical protein K2H72_09380 [Muribaculaceae bacterium]|nr:hypothetical protein [Muribaculaceae bacterium]